MSKDYIAITRDISSGIKTLRKDIPDVMSGFSAMAGAATKDGALSKKVKELVALGIAISTRCIGFHTEALIKLGTTKAEFEETLGLAVYMGGGLSLMYAGDAMMAWEQFGGPEA